MQERYLCESTFLLMRYIFYIFFVSPGKETFLAGTKTYKLQHYSLHSPPEKGGEGV